MQGVQNIQIDGAKLLEGTGGKTKQDVSDIGFVSAGTHQAQETEKLTKGERTAEVTYQKPQQENQGGTSADVMGQAENIDAAMMKKKMVVAANTTTPTDCAKMEEEGFSLQQTDAKTIVTVTDKIKMELAKAGVDISYFGDDLSAEQLESLAGNAALAQELSSRIKELQADLPLTAENVEDCRRALEEAGELHNLSEGAVKYMLDNQLEPTIANLYKAQYSGSTVYMNQEEVPIALDRMHKQISRIIVQAGLTPDEQTFENSHWLIQNQIPLTADNLQLFEQLTEMSFPQEREALLDGMLAAIAEGRRPQDAALHPQHSQKAKAEHAVNVVNMAADEDLAYLISQGEPVTIKNLERAHNENAAGAWSEQERQAAAELLQSTDAAVQAAGVDSGVRDVQAASLGSAQASEVAAEQAGSAQASEVAAEQAGAVQAGLEGGTESAQPVLEPGSVQAAAGSTSAAVGVSVSVSETHFTQVQILLITARRQLEEVRLIMTVESSYKMFQQGISVDTSSMEELIQQLKEIENSFYKNLLTEGGVEATQANVSLFAETTSKLEELKEMPAYALGARNMTVSTLEELHQEGGSMQQNFQQANERYETMQTQVRKELGDSIEKAFGNIDTILKDLGQEVSPVNERAVRILGYNQIEITAENITRMKAADQQVQMAFHNLTPSVIREFINRGINPLDLDIRELNVQAEQMKAELKIDAPEEKYSEYLYKLEQNHSISQEERSSYIGIYRLMNHVVQSDGAAVGALVNQGAQITMRNLLAAVRTQNRGEMDITVDHSFGALQSGGYLDSITDQIEAGYQHQCVKQAFDEISPERLRMLSDGWEDLTPEQFLQQLQETPEDLDAQESYYRTQLQDLVECANSSEQVYQVLERYDLPNTVMNVMAVSEYLTDRNSAFRRFFSLGSNGRTPDISKNTDDYMSKNEDGSVEVDFDAIQEELLARFGEDVKKPKELAKAVAELAERAEKCMSTMIMEPHVTSLDIRGLKLMNAQMSMHVKMASSECFSMPIVIDGEVTNVTMKIIRDKEQRGIVNITLDTARFGKIAAELRAKQRGGFSGYVVTGSNKTRDLLKSMDNEIRHALQEVEEGSVNINYILNGSLDLNTFEANSGTSEQPESEQMREVQTKTLYGMAEAFIRVIRHIG